MNDFAFPYTLQVQRDQLNKVSSIPVRALTNADLACEQLTSLEAQLKELKTKSAAKEQQEESQPIMGPGFGSRLMLTQGATGMANGYPNGGMMNGGMMPQATGFY